jgi:hypothetical protein
MSTGPGSGRARPSLLNRALASAKREVPTANLEAFQRAGAAVFELDLLVDARRADLHAGGTHPWDADGASCSLFLAAWVARVHQTLGTEVLDADQSLDPGTRGYVPPATHRQAWAFFQPVPLWLACAQRASATPDYWIGNEVELPAGLPSVFRLGDAPRKHLKGLLIAADAVDRLVDQQLGAVLSVGDPPQALAAAVRPGARAGRARPRSTALRAGALAPRRRPGAPGDHHPAPAAGHGDGAPPRAVPRAAGAARPVPHRAAHRPPSASARSR